MPERRAKQWSGIFPGTRCETTGQNPTRTLRRFLSDQQGATAIEYGLLAMLVALACVASFTIFGDALGNLFGTGPGGASNVIARQTEKLG